MHIVHNCHAHGCKVTSTRTVWQERLQTSFTEDEILHSSHPDDLMMNLGQLRSACYTQQFQPPQQSYLDPREDIIEAAVVNRAQVDADEASSRQRVTTVNAGTMGPPPPPQRRRKRTSTTASEIEAGPNTTANATRHVPSTPKRARTRQSPPPLDGALLHAAALS